MTWYKTVHIECDGHEQDCMSEPDAHYSDSDGVESAREDLAKHGWVYRDGRDLCPVCVIRMGGCTCEINLYWKDDKFLVPYDEPEDIADDCPVHNLKKAAG